MNLTRKSRMDIAAARGGRFAVALAFAGTILLGGCDDSNNQLVSAFQQLGSPGVTETATAAPPNGIKPIAPAPPAIQNTGTAMGAKTMTIRADLQRLSDGLNRRNAEFHRAEDAYARDIRAYADIAHGGGAAPANAAPGAPSARARGRLDHVAQDVAQLNAIASEVASEVALSAYIEQEMKSAAAFEAAPQDKRQLASLRTAAETDRVIAGRLATVVNAELARRNERLAEERRRLDTGEAAAHPGHAAAPGQTAAATKAPPRSGASAAAHHQRPLVTIRFDRPDVPYQQVLYTAVKRALERRPDATFDLVAVSPARDDEAQLKTVTNRAQHDAEDVLRTLSSMGLPAARVRVSAMMSSEVATNEVQIFVR